MSKIKEGNATITKSDGTKLDVQFICGRCQRLTIWTNPFVKNPNSTTRTMQCDGCGYSEFWVRTHQKD